MQWSDPPPDPRVEMDEILDAMTLSDEDPEALTWLGSLDIKPVYELGPIPVPAAAPTPSARPRIDFLDTLVLGAPGGKTELLGGRVPRQFVAGSPAEARKVFKHRGRRTLRSPRPPDLAAPVDFCS